MAALILVLSMQPNLRMTRMEAPESRAVAVILSPTVSYQEWQTRTGWMTCTTTTYPDGRKVGHADEVVAMPESLEHELLHAADCVDDGALNGSPLRYKPTTDDPAHEWVRDAQAHPEEAIKIMSTRMVK